MVICYELDKERHKHHTMQSDDAIKFLQFVYVEYGSLVLSEPLIGCVPGSNFNMVTLNYPDEFLTSISGSCTFGYRSCVSSITFGTNQGSHGPFGKPEKDDIEFNFQMGKYRLFGGFHGTTTSNSGGGGMVREGGVVMRW
ncbi:hypothetical protein ACSBR2_013662 [Camellia fascicularis]